MASQTDGGALTLVPPGIAGAVVGAFQLLVTWFILGNEDVLLRQVPLTVAAIATAEAFSCLRLDGQPQSSAAGMRVAFSASLVALTSFCFVAAIATSRGKEPIGDPPAYAEWAIALGCVFVAFIAAGFMGRRYG